MKLLRLHDSAVDFIEDKVAPWLIPTLARIVFALVFFFYFFNSAGTKLDAWATPSFGAFGQIFPRVAEAVSYDLTQASFFQKVVMVLGAWAEYALPVLILIGLATRLAAIGMIGFIIVQSLTDIYGHGLGPADIGAWFDNVASAVILDQRTLWVFLLLILVVRGAGPISVDAVLGWIRRSFFGRSEEPALT
ncbi:MAG: DoxX family protein [Pseudomonadota bacterium]